MCSGQPALSLAESGEGGIRTLERACAPYSLSRRVPSATRPPLRAFELDCRNSRGTARLVSWSCPAAPHARARADLRPRSRRRLPSSTSTRCGRTATRCWRGRARSRSGWRASRCAAGRCSSGSSRRDERFAGLMTFTLPETLWLAEQGFENLLLAYPTADTGALERAGAALGRQPGRGADRDGRLRRAPRRDRVGAGRPARRRCGSASTLDAGWWALGGRIKVGPKRSPVHTVEQAVALAREIERRPQLELAALMAYEGQIAGVGDQPPGRRLRGAAIRSMQRRSAAELAERRAAVVAAIREFAELPIVNGGGTGSLELTGAEDAVTEIAAGSGFYAPTLFDAYSRFSLTPAAGFALPIVRKPSRRRRDRARRRLPRLGQRRRRSRLPSPWLPAGPRARPRGGRRRGPDPAQRRRRRATCRSATASTCATPRRASSASASTPSTWSRARRSSTSSPPTAARARPSSSGDA